MFEAIITGIVSGIVTGIVLFFLTRWYNKKMGLIDFSIYKSIEFKEDIEKIISEIKQQYDC